MTVWTLAHNMQVRKNAYQKRWPGLVVGTIGDDSHAAGRSDHNRDARNVVHALDVMATGATAAAVVNDALAHPDDLEYIIHNRTIWARSTNWQPRRYNGSDPHTNHCHLSGRHGTTGYSSRTGTGYDLAAERSTPIVFGTKPPPSPTTPATPATAPKWPGRVLTYTPGQPLMYGGDVRAWQDRMKARGWTIVVDGFYGEKSAAVCKAFQQDSTAHHWPLDDDGQVGPKTWNAAWARPRS